jgi:hypothetical protein
MAAGACCMAAGACCGACTGMDQESIRAWGGHAGCMAGASATLLSPSVLGCGHSAPLPCPQNSWRNQHMLFGRVLSFACSSMLWVITCHPLSRGGFVRITVRPCGTICHMSVPHSKGLWCQPILVSPLHQSLNILAPPAGWLDSWQRPASDPGNQEFIMPYPVPAQMPRKPSITKSSSGGALLAAYACCRTPARRAWSLAALHCRLPHAAVQRTAAKLLATVGVGAAGKLLDKPARDKRPSPPKACVKSSSACISTLKKSLPSVVYLPSALPQIWHWLVVRPPAPRTSVPAPPDAPSC